MAIEDNTQHTTGRNYAGAATKLQQNFLMSFNYENNSVSGCQSCFLS